MVDLRCHSDSAGSWPSDHSAGGHVSSLPEVGMDRLTVKEVNACVDLAENFADAVVEVSCGDVLARDLAEEMSVLPAVATD